MEPVRPDAVVAFTVAAVLLGTALAVLALARRRRAVFVLAFFLVLVAVNFAADATYLVGPRIPPLQTLALVAVALDPFYLLLFVSAFRRGSVRAARALSSPSSARRRSHAMTGRSRDSRRSVSMRANTRSWLTT